MSVPPDEKAVSTVPVSLKHPEVLAVIVKPVDENWSEILDGSEPQYDFTSEEFIKYTWIGSNGHWF